MSENVNDEGQELDYSAPSNQNQEQQIMDRQMQFQRALERNLRSYISYSQQNHQLLIFITILMALISLFLLESFIFLSLSIIYEDYQLAISFILPLLLINLSSSFFLFKKSRDIQRYQKEIWEGLQWFQYDFDNAPSNNGILKIMQGQGIMSKLVFYLFFQYLTIFNFRLQSLIIIVEIYLTLSYYIEITINCLAILISLIIRIILITLYLIALGQYYFIKKSNQRAQFQINSIQELEYEQYSPLNNYPVQIVTQNDLSSFEDIVCIICLQAFQIKDPIIRLQCHNTHIYHKLCLSEWIVSTATCPACRQNV